MKGRVEFTTPVFTGGYADIGKEDEGKLGRVDDDAVGMHAPGLGHRSSMLVLTFLQKSKLNSLTCEKN